MIQFEQKKPKGGKRPGAGRPRGKKTKAVIDREKMISAMRQRVMGVAQGLVTKQMHLAIGQSFLYKIEKKWIDTGKNKGFWKNSKPILVDNDKEIAEYLERTITEGDDSEDRDDGATYYFITTKEGDGRVIEAMLDRTFGRPQQAVSVTGSIEIGQLLDQAEQER